MSERPDFSPEAIAEARALLATTTLPTELHVARIAETFQGAPMLVGYRVTFVPDGDPCRCFGCMGQIDNARLLANAPTWLAQLLAALEASERENERLRAAVKTLRRIAEAEPDGDATLWMRKIARDALAALTPSTPPDLREDGFDPRDVSILGGDPSL